ncbi:LuxR C-terminal-related transcriptional regulator [Flavobacteriaceae bacterium SZ-1-7]|uniref:two-component regulator propeller domain-containing protein n=1 Tax=Tamlana sedimenti TaxID=3134126 RepID=UPI0031283A22
MRLLKLLLVGLLICVFGNLTAQELPPIEIYTPEDYNANNQNWSISQSSNRFIYVGNNKGLLEFNGEEWQLYESPNKTIMRSVKAIGDQIFTGCFREFGYWQRDSLGLLNYVSVSKKLDVSFLEDEEIWNIIDVDDIILFQSLKRIYIYNKRKESYDIIDSETTINRIFKAGNRVYFQKARDGLYEIEHGSAKLVTDDKVGKENLLVNVFNHQNKLLIQTQDNGFYILENNELIPWSIEANDILLNDHIYCSAQLEDKSFVLGSISNGFLHISEEGRIMHQISQNKGLSNNTVLSVFEDTDSNIWLGLEYGINCINMKSAFRIYDDRDGKIGSVNTSIIFNGYLYIGTNSGLFFKRNNTNEAFRFISGTQGAVWSLQNINGALFCGHNTGTFVIENNKADLIVDIIGTWRVIPVKNNSNLLLQGDYDGFYVLEKVNGKWGLRNKIEGFDVSSRYFEMVSETEVLVSHEYRGVFKVDLNKQFTEASAVTVLVSEESGTSTSLIKYNNHILYTNKDGVFKYTHETNIFEKDSVLSKLIDSDHYTSGRLVHDTISNKLWSFSSQGLSYLTPNRLSGAPKIHKVPIQSSAINHVVGFENILSVNNGEFLYGTTSGYLLLDLNKLDYPSHEVKLNYTFVSSLKNDTNVRFIDTSTEGDFKNTENNFEFHYCVPKFNKFQVTEYQYILEGIYEDWSEWSQQPHEAFENLPFGDYTFSVRSRIGNRVSNNIESYSFSIEAPWYLTKAMIALYIAFVVLFSLFMHNVYKRYYRKQRERLLLKSQRELERKELENRQQLMRFNNDKLRQDIENKNKELATSTMNLIRKNEFLNNLKTELKKTSDTGKGVKSIIKIIDKNLNNTDDWHLFEEAFNNADKDFLKKIKSDHPSLTSNDLRLCAYLRLNLSSKEIAPLLNISPRSVEVKRYRLRKKLDLPHEASLTDYILEV